MGKVNIIDNNLETYRKFASKAKRGDPVVVGYLGGSISVGEATFPLQGMNMDGQAYHYNYDLNEDSWRALTYKWLREKFEIESGQFRQVNAAIGGTDSIFGAYRLKKHLNLLEDKAPDLLFVEFAVNDVWRGKTSLEDPYEADSIFNSYLSILTQVKAVNPDVAVFVPVSTYRMNSDAWKDVKPLFDLSAEAAIKAANLFKLPYVDIRNIFYKEPLPEGISRSRLFDGQDSHGNGVHPSPEGYKAYAAGVIGVLEDVFNSQYHFDFTDVDIDASKLVPYPAQAVYAVEDEISAGMKGFDVGTKGADPSLPVENMKRVFTTRLTGAVFAFKFQGESVGINFILENCYGSADVYLDRKNLGVWRANSTEKADIPANRCNIFAKGLDPDITHILEFKPCQDQPLADGKAFCIQIRGVVVNGKYEGK